MVEDVSARIAPLGDLCDVWTYCVELKPCYLQYTKSSAIVLPTSRRILSRSYLVEGIVERGDRDQSTGQREVLAEVLGEVSRVESRAVDSCGGGHLVKFPGLQLQP